MTAQQKADNILEMAGLEEFFKDLRSLSRLAAIMFHGTPCIWYHVLQTNDKNAVVLQNQLAEFTIVKHILLDTENTPHLHPPTIYIVGKHSPRYVEYTPPPSYHLYSR